MVAIRGVDTTDKNLTGAILKAHGYDFVCRYIRNAPVDNPNQKEWSRAEVAEKSAAGVRVVANFEWGTKPANTVSTGRAHANIFVDELASVGGPSWAPCYFSIDTSANAHQFDAYFGGLCDVLGPARVGVYGNGDLFRQLKADGLASLAWQSMSRSFPGNHLPGQPAIWDHRGADIIQQFPNGSVAGHSCDFDTATITNYGGWLLGEENPIMATLDKDDIAAIKEAILDDPRHVDMTWRVHAMATMRATYQAGSMANDPVAFTAALQALPTTAGVIDVAKLAAALAPLLTPSVLAQLNLVQKATA